jgi:hypothetical protein
MADSLTSFQNNCAASAGTRRGISEANISKGRKFFTKLKKQQVFVGTCSWHVLPQNRTSQFETVSDSTPEEAPVKRR